MNYLKTAFVAVVAVALVGCGGATSSSDHAQRTQTASYAINVYDGAFSFLGNSIRIVGDRSVLADAKYPCASSFDVCLPLQADGTIAEPVLNLCPSANTPEGNWDFTYTLFADLDCQTPMANLQCIETVAEPLPIGGEVTNAVKCETWNASKDITVCIYDPVTLAWSGYDDDPSTPCPAAP